ncbi:MAG TPA: hypothetical protein VL442_10875, partial [Mucilaginibacter sp.]|nr:hypothetical protein [Mucilaginibacter sp.]
MFKYFFLLSVSLSLVSSANGMVKDTSIYYYKIGPENSYIISTPDNCDFFRLILPPDSGQKLLNIKDYY